MTDYFERLYQRCTRDLSLVQLLGAVRACVPAYGSGAFTPYSHARLAEQAAEWVAQGFSRIKIKVGRTRRDDVDRVRLLRKTIGVEAELFVDANGAYARKQALALAESFAAFDVSWFEEPVSSDDLEGLRILRRRGPVGIRIAAGEYGYTLPYFRRMLEAEAVDVVQADATRCGGSTGLLGVAALYNAFFVPPIGTYRAVATLASVLQHYRRPARRVFSRSCPIGAPFVRRCVGADRGRTPA